MEFLSQPDLMLYKFEYNAVRAHGRENHVLTNFRLGVELEMQYVSLERYIIVRWMTQVKKNFVAPPRYQGCYISSCREFYAEFNAKCCQSGNLCRKFENMIL